MFMHYENKGLLNACMLEMECVYLLKSKFVNAGIVNSLPKNGHEGAHVPVGEGMNKI